MSVEQWRPLSERLRGVGAAGGWREPVPAALESPLREWVDLTLGGAGPFMPSVAVSRIAERLLLRLDLMPPADDAGDEGELDSRAAARQFLAYGVSVELLPDVVDAVLFLLPAGQRVTADPSAGAKVSAVMALASFQSNTALMWADERRKTLTGLLDDALSVLRVRPGGRGLERRSDPDAEAAFGEAVSAAEGLPAAGSASAHLRAAWGAVHALHPDAGKAYSEAIKAAEAAAHAVVEPTNRKATLGTMIRYLRDHPGRFSLVIRGRDGLGEIGPLISCMSLLWDGQSSRHGSSTPTRVESIEEAAMAVHLAVTLVQWFVSGAIRRSPLPGTVRRTCRAT